MKRQTILSESLFDTGGNVCGIEFGPLSPPRVQILTRRGNKHFSAKPKDQAEAEAMAEILFVLSRTPEQRQQLFRVSDDEWQDQVAEFFESLPDKALDTFAIEYVVKAFVALKAAGVESEGPGKRDTARTRATSQPSSKQRKGSGSTRSRKP